jgi:hypothetical protein
MDPDVLAALPLVVKEAAVGLAGRLGTARFRDSSSKESASSAAGPVSPLSRVRKLISGLAASPDSGSRVVLIRSLVRGGACSSDESESGRAEVDPPPVIVDASAEVLP